MSKVSNKEKRVTIRYTNDIDDCVLTYIVILIIITASCLICNIISTIYLKNILNLLIKIAYG